MGLFLLDSGEKLCMEEGRFNRLQIIMEMVSETQKGIPLPS
jgi:hypothetical protein